MLTKSEGPQIGVILINWNGWADTIECLDSLLQASEARLDITVVDNGSSDDSVDRIRDWARTRVEKEQLLDVRVVNWGKSGWSSGAIPTGGKYPALRIVRVWENTGFAKGANIGMRVAALSSPKLYWLLNNDTIVDPLCPSVALQAFGRDAALVCATGPIVYSGDRSTVWNCGGWLWYGGLRKYSSSNHPLASVPKSGVQRRTFVTGCSMFLRGDILTRAGMLSEDFFFGEEDIEFCLRLRRLKLKMGCIYGALVAHKVSASADRLAASDSNLGRAYVQYLNRLVHYKRYLSPLAWRLWKALQLAVAAITLLRVYRVGAPVLFRFVSNLWRQSERLVTVDRETFVAAIQERWK